MALGSMYDSQTLYVDYTQGAKSSVQINSTVNMTLMGCRSVAGSRSRILIALVKTHNSQFSSEMNLEKTDGPCGGHKGLQTTRQSE